MMRELFSIPPERAFWLRGPVIDLPAEADQLPAEPGAPRRPPGYDLIGGVAVIPIWGLLVQKLGSPWPIGGLTGYDGIRTALVAAMKRPRVAAIAFNIDSFGGAIAGLFDLADMIRSARGQKPIWSILAETACGAAYVIASAADRISVPRTGSIGGVGVMTMHADHSVALRDAGIGVTLLRYGGRKADGNEYQPLSGRARAMIQSELDTTGKLMVGTVARNRNLDPKAVRRLGGGTLLGMAGMQAGLADAVMAPDAALAKLVASLR